MRDNKKYRAYLDEHLRAITRSGYHEMTKGQQIVAQMMSIQTVHSFLQSIEIVQRMCSKDCSLEDIKKKFHLDDTQVITPWKVELKKF